MALLWLKGLTGPPPNISAVSPFLKFARLTACHAVATDSTQAAISTAEVYTTSWLVQSTTTKKCSGRTRYTIWNLVNMLNINSDVFRQTSALLISRFLLEKSKLRGAWMSFWVEWQSKSKEIEKSNQDKLTMKLALEHLFRCPDAQASHLLVIIHDTKGSLKHRTSRFSNASY